MTDFLDDLTDSIIDHYRRSLRRVLRDAPQNVQLSQQE